MNRNIADKNKWSKMINDDVEITDVTYKTDCFNDPFSNAPIIIARSPPNIHDMDFGSFFIW